jgi:hypothetical protein
VVRAIRIENGYNLMPGDEESKENFREIIADCGSGVTVSHLLLFILKLRKETMVTKDSHLGT